MADGIANFCQTCGAPIPKESHARTVTKRGNAIIIAILSVITLVVTTFLLLDKTPQEEARPQPISRSQSTPAAAPLAQMLNGSLSSHELKLVKAELAGIPASSSRFAEAQQLLGTIEDRITQAEKEEAREKNVADAKRIEILKSNIESLKTVTDIPATKEAILIRVASFAAMANLVAEAESSNDPNVKRVGAQFRAQLSRTQAVQFPKLRQAWAAIADQAMWEHDMDVRVLGEGNQTIELISGVFAANRNIKQIHTTIQEALENLRFKRVQYRWFKGADEYTYFALSTPADTAVAR